MEIGISGEAVTPKHVPASCVVCVTFCWELKNRLKLTYMMLSSQVLYPDIDGKTCFRVPCTAIL